MNKQKRGKKLIITLSLLKIKVKKSRILKVVKMREDLLKENKLKNK